MNKRRVELQITGDNSVKFLNALQQGRIRVTNVYVRDNSTFATIAYDDLKKVRKARSHFRVKLRIHYVSDAFLQPQLKILIGLLLLVCIPLFAQNYFWQITVEAPKIEQRVKAEQFLQRMTLPLKKSEVAIIQQMSDDLLLQLPDIAWVHVQQKGSVLAFTLQPTPYVEVPQTVTSTSFIASRQGVIDRYFIASGQLLVKRGDTVQKGEVLVENVVTERAQAQVFADYYETVSFKMPKVVYYGTSSGKKGLELTSEHIDTHILPLVERKLLMERPADTKLTLQKILHVTFDNDTVKGEVLYLVNENIAIPSSNRARR